jgi:hypothetical protein
MIHGDNGGKPELQISKSSHRTGWLDAYTDWLLQTRSPDVTPRMKKHGPCGMTIRQSERAGAAA